MTVLKYSNIYKKGDYMDLEFISNLFQNCNVEELETVRILIETMIGDRRECREYRELTRIIVEKSQDLVKDFENLKMMVEDAGIDYDVEMRVCFPSLSISYDDGEDEKACYSVNSLRHRR